MTFISKKSFITYEEDDDRSVEYKLPKLVVTAPEVIPIKKSFAIATAIHPAFVLLVWLIVIALAFLGFDFDLFKKPQISLKKDIEFVLVDKEATPINKNTKNRADINSRSGGINDPKRPLSMPSPSPKKASKPSASASNANKIIKKQQQQAQQKAQNKPQTAKQQTQAKNNQQAKSVNKPSTAKPAPPTARPSTNPLSTIAPTAKPSSAFTVPKPANAPVGKTLATGPIGGTSASTGNGIGGGSASSGKSSGSSAPKPSLSPSSGGSAGSLGRSSTGGGGNGNPGNPGGGGGTPGIDALREPDFGPYMRELQRKIKMNWEPPKGNESKRVILLFKIAKDGRLLSCRINKSSGLPTADQAALKAVELSAPFRPLPADFKGQSIDIQFTFDYNVFNATRY